MIIKIVIGHTSLTEQNAFILSYIDVLKGNIELTESKNNLGEAYIIVKCRIDLGKRKCNELKKYIKRILNVKYVYYTYED
ncbi:MAG: hypothetical protein GY679_00945 [Mycoplasma sp.]|nr:hypothetical protein [Mycoplasma sp.]